ncbi:MAG: hypothetical protein M1527_02000 [Gammaproteobacteria bacterium]|nr:hypothetical protein [Gammaproteobacteria bacterium]
MKKLLLAAMALLAAGCASTQSHYSQSPTQNFRLAGADDLLVIAGAIETRDDSNGWTVQRTNTLTVTINGERALQGKLNREYTGDLVGGWKDKSTAALCSSSKELVQHVILNTVQYSYRYSPRCVFLIDGEMAVTLTF